MKRFIYALMIPIVFPAPTAVADVSKAKTAGLACESSSGYLVAAGSAPNNIKVLVTTVNTKRKAHYEHIAVKNGIEVAQVASLTARKLQDSEPQHSCR